MSAGTHPVIHAGERIRELERDNAVLRDLVRAREADLKSLQEDLRDCQQLLAGFQEMPGVHIYVDWPKNRFLVERRYRREYGCFDAWSDAVKLVRELRTTLARVGRLDDLPSSRAFSARS